ncbi:MAG: amidohydrolase family protein [Selenomonas sp.]|uniref:amidohydrolase family protein n=1 Tax=Selenomonas sp. TaxID=2053611 RepID=UPI0025EFEEC4|nr:amidohydrolase family protein [Selenomonas sp.]MCR5757465.1 amidohydrolase family protein [Selenomonas sp.]
MLRTIIEPEACFWENRLQKGIGILVTDGTITAIGPAAALKEEYPGSSISHWDNLALVPGTVNAHNHSFQSLLRGIAADRPFLEWRDESLYKYSPKMRPQDIYTGALFAFAEMMKCGVTTVCDFFYLHNDGVEGDEAVIQAARDIGIRLVLARTMYDWQGAPAGYVETVQQAYENTGQLMQKYPGGMTKVLPAPHSLHAASPEMVQAGWDLAHKFQTPFHIHVSEERFEVEQVRKTFGTTPLRYLDKLGVADERLCIIHGVWLEQEEIECMGQQGCRLIYCPSSNMFLADGITDIPAFLRQHIPIALGSDGACGNNRISVFEEMRMVSLLQKARTLDALCVNYQDAMDMGTRQGAGVLDLPVGELAPGKAADFVGLRLDDFSLQPLSQADQFLPNLIYSLQPTAIDRVMVNGVETVRHNRLLNMTEAQVLSHVKNTMNYLEA